MTAKKNTMTEAVAAATPAVEAAAASRTELVARMACGLLQSPRFCSRITDTASQDLLVALAVVLADKVLAAAKG